LIASGPMIGAFKTMLNGFFPITPSWGRANIQIIFTLALNKST
jgi:hypothetical protein